MLARLRDDSESGAGGPAEMVDDGAPKPLAEGPKGCRMIDARGADVMMSGANVDWRGQV